MDWNTVGTEVLKWVVAVVLPVTAAYVIKGVKAWIAKHLNGLWREWALEIVTEIEARSEGKLVGAQKRLMAVTALVERGVPKDKVDALIEWAVATQQETLEYIVSKQIAREASE